MEVLIEDISSLEEVKNKILDLRLSEELVMIRKGRQVFSPDAWIKFLDKSCGLQQDRRHYSYSEKLELADWWEISYQPDKATSYAHSNTKQPFHTDNAWFADPAEINFFIMEKQAKLGGEQIVYRLSRLMEDLSKQEAGLFKDLCQTKVIIRKGYANYFNETTIIKNDHDPRIFWNYYRTEKTDKHIKNMCEAFFKFLDSKEDSSSVEVSMSMTGDCFAFNDTKLLHARKSFEAKLPYDRVLIQSMWQLPSHLR